MYDYIEIETLIPKKISIGMWVYREIVYAIVNFDRVSSPSHPRSSLSDGRPNCVFVLLIINKNGFYRRP